MLALRFYLIAGEAPYTFLTSFLFTLGAVILVSIMAHLSSFPRFLALSLVSFCMLSNTSISPHSPTTWASQPMQQGRVGLVELPSSPARPEKLNQKTSGRPHQVGRRPTHAQATSSILVSSNRRPCASHVPVLRPLRCLCSCRRGDRSGLGRTV